MTAKFNNYHIAYTDSILLDLHATQRGKAYGLDWDWRLSSGARAPFLQVFTNVTCCGILPCETFWFMNNHCWPLCCCLCCVILESDRLPSPRHHFSSPLGGSFMEAHGFLRGYFMEARLTRYLWFLSSWNSWSETRSFHLVSSHQLQGADLSPAQRKQSAFIPPTVKGTTIMPTSAISWVL